MSLLAFVMALLLTDSSPASTLIAWGDGLPLLMTFTAQLCITLLAAHALAHTDEVQSLLKFVGVLPKQAASAYILFVVGAALGSLIASAYAGFVVWHMGYSASAPLFVATPGHSLEQAVGIIPITQTIFTWENLAIIVAIVTALAIVYPLMRPEDKEIIQFEPEQGEPLIPMPRNEMNPASPAEWLETRRLPNLVVGGALLASIGVSFVEQGFFLTLDIVNWSLLGLGLLLSRSPVHYVRLIYNASSSVGAIIIQYPFYAGMLGIMTATGLAAVMSGWFADIATPQTLGFTAFLSAGLVNLFIPSGGGQWAVQGPVFIDAAQQIGVAPEVIVMAIAYGDQWTNMIQPFWTIPLLAIAGLHVRQVMGYTVVIFLVTMVIFGGSL